MQSVKKAENYYFKSNKKATMRISNGILLQTLIMLRKLLIISISITCQSQNENKQSTKQLKKEHSKKKFEIATCR